jgi:hypothetical protein
MPAPTVTAQTNKTTYQQGEPVTFTAVVVDAPVDVAQTRTIEFSGHDSEGNTVDGVMTITSRHAEADTFVLDYVRWQDTGVNFAINGLQATGTA